MLLVEDAAGNYERSRRIITFDDQHNITISDHKDDVIWIPSATEDTSYTWITTLDQLVSHTQIITI